MKTDLIAGVLILGLVFIGSYSCCFADDDLVSVITAIKTETPIKIDGKIDAEEWKYGVCATGFVDMQGNFASDDTIFYITYDNERLYVAFKSTVNGKPKAKETERDGREFFQDDVVELRFQPDPDKDLVYLFAGNAKGIIYDSKLVNRKVATPDENNWDWEYKNQVVDSGKSMAGIATFAQSIWTGEVSIPFKQLGTSMPGNGAQWRVNFFRDWGNKEMRKDKPQWTCWSPTFGAFALNSKYGYLNFMEKAPVVRVCSFGDVVAGDVQVEGNVFNPTLNQESIEINLILSLAAKDKELRKDETSLPLPPSQSTQIKLGEMIELTKSASLKNLLVVSDSKSKKIVYKKGFLFTASPGFHVVVNSYYTQKIVEMSIDTRRLGALNFNTSIYADIYNNTKGAEELIKRVTFEEVDNEKQHVTHSFSSKELLPGKYIVKAFLEDKSKKIIARSNADFEIPHKPEWLGNKLGFSEKVPPPFEPLRVKGKSIFVWGREYRFDKSIFPSQIMINNKSLLASGMSLNIVTEQGDVKWEESDFKLVYQKETEAKFHIKQKHSLLDLNAEILIEYDGFIRVDFTLVPRQTLVIKNIFLQVPLTEQNALYANGLKPGLCLDSAFASYAACLYKGAKGKNNSKLFSLRRHHFSANGWIWPDKFIYYLWVGGDDKGISLSFDSDKNFQTEKYAEIITGKRIKYIKYNFVDSPLDLAKPLTYTIGIQATPVKPLPKDPRRYHFGFVLGRQFDPVVDTACLCWGIKGTGWHVLTKHTAGHIKAAKKANVNYVVYDSVNLVAADVVPDFKYFSKEWVTDPVEKTYFRTYDSMCLSVSFKGTYQDHYLWSLNNGIKSGLDMGIYYDVSGPLPDTNIYNGSGYVDKDGKRKLTTNFFETRQGYKRVYTLFKSYNPDASIFHHTMPPSPMASFVDMVIAGEELHSVEGKDYSNLSPDFYRVSYGAYQNQYGIPFAMHDGRFEKHQFPFEDGIPLFLIHNIYTQYTGQATIEILKPIWAIMDKWYTTSVWIPYWKTGNLISSFDEKVKISLYQKKEKRKYLMLIANLDYDHKQDGKLKLDFKSLGYRNDKLQITDMMKNEMIPLTGSEFYVSLPANSIHFYQLEKK